MEEKSNQKQYTEEGVEEVPPPPPTPTQSRLFQLIVISLFSFTIIFPSWHYNLSLPFSIPAPISLHSHSKRSQPDLSPPPIAISNDIPFIPTSSPYYSQWTTLLASLSNQATSDLPDIKGVPGTGIETDLERKELQNELDSMTVGEWRWDEVGEERSKRGGLTVHKQSGGLGSCDKAFYKTSPVAQEEGEWNVRPSLKYSFHPSSPPTSPRLSRRSLCKFLAHKSTLLIGDLTQYTLHDLLLDYTTMSPQTCYGDLYCKEHRICGEIIDDGSELDEEEDRKRVESWEGDERVFIGLDAPPTSSLIKRSSTSSYSSPDDTVDAKLSPRQSKSTSPTSSTLLRYRRSDSLLTSSHSTSPNYINPYTQIREFNQIWLPDARRSDLVVLSKPPLPVSMDFEREWKSDEEEGEEEKIKKVIEEVGKVTAEVWLPDLVRTLKALRSPPSPEKILIVFRSSWRIQPTCGTSSQGTTAGDGLPFYDHQPSFHEILFEKEGERTDLHTLSYNLQLILHNAILRLLLPSFGIPFLDLTSISSPLRSGMLGSSSSSSAFTMQQKRGLRTPTSGDCNRYCLPSPGSFLEDVFVGGLERVMRRGWGERERWMGEGFKVWKEGGKEE